MALPLLALSLIGPGAMAAAPAIEVEPPPSLSDSDKAEIVDFVVGNAVFALYHQAGHMLMDRFHVSAGQGETGADQFATLTLLEPRSGAGDQTLVDAIDSWHLSVHQTASVQPIDITILDRHALDGNRANAIACDMVGADPKGFADVADAASLDSAARIRCAETYRKQRDIWSKALAPLRRPAGTEPADIAVFYDEPNGGEVIEATILEDNGVLEEVADRLANDFSFPSPPTIRAKSCGVATSKYDADTNELVLCYEMAAYDTALIIHDIESRN